MGTDHHQYIVDVTGVTSGQYLTITLNGAHDDQNHSGDVAVTMGGFVGDTTGNGAVNSSHISQSPSQSGQPLTQDNFREDVTVNGSINSSDISLVQSKSGTALPPAP